MRVTINTGKVLIGSAYTGKKRVLTADEEHMQAVLLAEMPAKPDKTAQVERLQPSVGGSLPRAKQTQPSAFYRFWNFVDRLFEVRL